jgi:hypothetical protein
MGLEWQGLSAHPYLLSGFSTSRTAHSTTNQAMAKLGYGPLAGMPGPMKVVTPQCSLEIDIVASKAARIAAVQAPPIDGQSVTTHRARRGPPGGEGG